MAGRFLILTLCIVGAYSLPVSQNNEISAEELAISIPNTGVINWPVVEAAAEKIGSILGSLKTRSSLTGAQIEDIISIANKIEGIVNIHFHEDAPKGGVINIPGFLDAVKSIIGSASSGSSLTEAQIDSIINVANKIEGIVNIHSLEVKPEAQRTLTEAQIDEIINIANKIEGIVNIHSLEVEPEAQRTLTEAQIDEIINIANKIEGIVNIHFFENTPKGGVINIPGFLDAIKSIIGSASVRTSLTEGQIDNIYNVLNKIEGIVNIH